MKRIFLVLCMLACILTLGGCQGSGESMDANMKASLDAYVNDVFSNRLITPEELEFLSESAKNQGDMNTVQSIEFSTPFYEAWAGVQDEIGDFISAEPGEGFITDDGYVYNADINFSKRMLKITLNIDQSQMISSANFNPQYTFAEKMQKAGLNTLLGMGTVFIVLIFISFIISGLKYVNVFSGKKDDQKTVIAAPPVPAAAAPVAETEDLTDDLELVAVITAAIAAASDTPADGLVVRSIRRASAGKWKRT